MNDLRKADLISNYNEIENCMKWLNEGINNKNSEEILNYVTRIQNRCYDMCDILDCIREDEEEG
jgi:hypothetical protein